MQALPRARGRYVQQARVFVILTLIEQSRHTSIQRILIAAARRDRCQQEIALILAARALQPAQQLGLVLPAYSRQPRYDDYVELEPLGLVDRHDLQLGWCLLIGHRE